jgi:hypothetical protein
MPTLQSCLPPAVPKVDRLTRPLFSLEFLEEHPGGAKILKRFGGKNATKPFWKYHNESVLKKYGAKLKIGTVAESAKL